MITEEEYKKYASTSSCYHCMKAVDFNLLSSYVRLEQVMHHWTSGKILKTLFFHIDCFREIAGEAYMHEPKQDDMIDDVLRRKPCKPLFDANGLIAYNPFGDLDGICAECDDMECKGNCKPSSPTIKTFKY
jgi:hypothetical protein